MSTHPAAPETAIVPESSLVPNATLRQIYREMLRCRAFRLRLASLAAEGRLDAGLVPAVQEEAMLSAIAVELRAADTLCGTRQDWLPAMLKGVAMQKIVRWLLAGPASRQLNDPVHRCEALPVRQQAQAAALLDKAVAHKRRRGSVVLAYIGGLEPGSWHEFFEVAARRRLPALLVYRTTVAEPASAELRELLETTQMPNIYVDGTDALALYRVAQESTGRARRNLGPTLIDCSFDGSAAEANGADSFSVMEEHLAAKGVFSQSWKDEIEAMFRGELEAAIDAAERRMSARKGSA